MVCIVVAKDPGFSVADWHAAGIFVGVPVFFVFAVAAAILSCVLYIRSVRAAGSFKSLPVEERTSLVGSLTDESTDSGEDAPFGVQT